jgi:hypothetical protein
MLERQEEQTGKRDASVFEKSCINGFDFSITPEGDDFWCTILIDNEISHFYTLYPKKESPYPKVMMVSDHGEAWLQRVVFMEKCGKYITWVNSTTIEESETAISTNSWNYAKDIEPIPSYTMEELFEKLGEFNLIK